ncbi:MAG: hypothetical protein Q8R40_03295 [bacterium]|nr:hypothetical protein [bacterium]
MDDQPWIVDIDEAQFGVLWQKIRGNKDQVPSVLLKEYPDEEMRKQDKKEKLRTLGLHTDNNMIYIFYKNFNSISYENKNSFHKKIVDTLAHEVSHARLTQGNVGMRSFLHNSIRWVLDMGYQHPFISAITTWILFFSLTFVGFVFSLSLPRSTTLLISLLGSFLTTCIAPFIFGILLCRCREAVTDSYAADLMATHKDDLNNIVRVISIADLFPKTAHGQFLRGYYSAHLAAKNPQQLP